MSWLSGYKATKKLSESEIIREEKRKKLEADRLARNIKREAHKKQLEAATRAREEASEILDQFLQIDPDIFAGDVIDEAIDENILNDSTEMANFDEKDEENGAEAIKSLGQIKVNWDAENPSYFFQKLETELQIFSINKQYTKRQALIRSLPDEVAKEFMHLVVLQETQAGNLSYKTLKTSIIKAYGPRPGDSFQRALNRVMVGKPSVLLKLLISDICDNNLAGCCCHRTVWGLFQEKIPMYLKTGLANDDFNSTNMHGIMDRADNLWSANQTTDKQIATVTTNSSVSPPVNAESAEVATVAARGRGRGRGFRGRNRGNRGGQRGGGTTNQGPDPRGKRHDSNPPWNSCGAHWVYADAAWKCQSPTTYPMKNKVTPKA